MLTGAVSELYPSFPYSVSILYSGRFKAYNANVKLRGGQLTFHFSKEWKGVADDIQKGLVQSLLLKIMKGRVKASVKNTASMDLYDIFLRKLHLVAPKTESDPILLNSFNRVNARFFDGLLELTNLRWGTDSYRKLGSYAYASDTITLSRLLEEDYELLDYVMYHEMLHKKHKYVRNKTRSHHHTKAFRDDERKFPSWELCEERLSRIGQKKRWLRGLLD
jgi:hypothetical protein|tara:strand:+ start:68 stop:727 length:660 start_codon:yes stop_codon:yes gene_type:complete